MQTAAKTVSQLKQPLLSLARQFVGTLDPAPRYLGWGARTQPGCLQLPAAVVLSQVTPTLLNRVIMVWLSGFCGVSEPL